MSENIKVESGSIAGQLSQFESEMASMQALFSELETQTSLIANSWQGDEGEAMISSIKGFLKVFEEIKAQNEKYVSFLNQVIDKYTETDSSISGAIDSAANNGLGINGSGN